MIQLADVPQQLTKVIEKLDEMEHDLATANRMIRLLTLLLASEHREGETLKGLKSSE